MYMRTPAHLALVLAIGFSGPAAAQTVVSVTTKQTFKAPSADVPSTTSTSPQAIIAPLPKTGSVITPPHIVVPITAAGAGGGASVPQPLASTQTTPGGQKTGGILTMPSGQKIGVSGTVGGIVSVPPTATDPGSAGGNMRPPAVTGGPDPKPLPPIKTGTIIPVDTGTAGGNMRPPGLDPDPKPLLPIKTATPTKTDLPPQTNTLPVQPGGTPIDIGIVKPGPATNWLPPSASVTPGGTVTPDNAFKPVDNGIAMAVPKNLLPDTQPQTFGGGTSMPVTSHPITATTNADGSVTIKGY